MIFGDMRLYAIYGGTDYTNAPLENIRGHLARSLNHLMLHSFVWRQTEANHTKLSLLVATL